MAESGSVLDQDTVAAGQLALAAKRREVERTRLQDYKSVREYKRAIARFDADEVELDAEVEHEAQFQQALND